MCQLAPMAAIRDPVFGAAIKDAEGRPLGESMHKGQHVVGSQLGGRGETLRRMQAYLTERKEQAA